MELLRTAIIVDKNLSPGQVGNVAAILMGQVARLMDDLFNSEPPVDLDGVTHAAIQFSTVVLTARSGQLSTASTELSARENLCVVAFTEVGQGLNNAYSEYSTLILQGHTTELRPVGLAVSGKDEDVRAVTKKFSLLS